jgi:hypothetical protein
MKEDQLEVISTYTDAEAVEDGMLVELERCHRATRPLWEYLVEHLPTDGQPPNRWPVSLLHWFGSAGTDAHRQLRTKAALIGLLGTHGTEARRVDAENIGGGIFTGYIINHPETGVITAFEVDSSNRKLGRPRNTPREDDPHRRRIWIMPNELGGLTVMFPEDY